MNKISQILSTLFYVGYFKWFPGTLGSLFSLIIIFFLKINLSLLLFIFLFFIIFIISMILISIYSNSINNIEKNLNAMKGSLDTFEDRLVKVEKRGGGRF